MGICVNIQSMSEYGGSIAAGPAAATKKCVKGRGAKQFHHHPWTDGEIVLARRLVNIGSLF